MDGARKLKNPNRAWIRPLAGPGGGARYLQIVRQIVTAVDDLVLRPGDRLPPQRELAVALGVDLTTVTRAYSELRALGLLEAQGAGGSYIKRKAQGQDTTVDLGMNIPPLLDSPFFAQLMKAGIAQAQERMASGDLMGYHVGAGALADRQAAAAWLQPMLGVVDPGRIIVCPGAQSALAALLLTCSRPGDGVLTEGLTYPGLLAAAQALDRPVLAVAADAEGMSPDALEDACARGGARVLYLNPTIHNPTTRTLSAERRAALHAVASRHGLAVIEDDPYWLIAGDAPAPLAAHAAGRYGAPVYYISTLSKCLAPGLRTAFIAMPHDAPVTPVLDALRSISLMPVSWMAAVATHAMATGMAQDMLQRVRHELAQRQSLAGRLLPQGVQSHPHGLHLWLALPPQADPYRLIQIAQQRGVGVADADAFRADETTVHKALRISLGGAVNQEQLRGALEKLSAILQEEQRPARAAGIV